MKGLHNYSNLPSGDLRVSRGTTTLHEQFIHPQDRAPVPPRHQHLQRTAAEPVDDDIGLGPVTMSEGTMGGGNTTAYDDAMFAKRTRVSICSFSICDKWFTRVVFVATFSLRFE